MVEESVIESLRQTGFGVRFDWGPTAALMLARGAGVLAVVDTLSFTTAVSVANGRGMAVVPYPLGDNGAAEVAARLDAALAVRREELSQEHPWSLSPRSLLSAPYAERLVLPSPNGSAIAASRSSGRSRDSDAPRVKTVVMAACLRNAAATARWMLAHGYGTDERPVWLIGAGERWPGGSLRPALEDGLGAGALADRLRRTGCVLSPEAEAAAETFAATPDLSEVIGASASGRELAAMGFPEDAEFAAELDADGHASVMVNGMFVST